MSFHDDPDQFIVPHLLKELKPDCVCGVCEVLREAVEEGFKPQRGASLAAMQDDLDGAAMAYREQGEELKYHIDIITNMRARLAAIVQEMNRRQIAAEKCIELSESDSLEEAGYVAEAVAWKQAGELLAALGSDEEGK